MRRFATLLLLSCLWCQAAIAGPALMFDLATGRILYADDPDMQWHPASLTKIMTAYVTFEAIRAGTIKIDDRIPYSENASIQAPSKLGLAVGAQLIVDSALKAVIIKSANDVSVALAEAVAGSEGQFVARMNNTAQRLGMTRTNFVNPNGLPALQQVTTARDLAKLARAVVKDFPEHAAYWSMFDARIGKIHLSTHNGLLRSFEGADGIKTGFTCDSGFNVVASATRNDRKLIAVVLGEATSGERTVRAASLLEHGFQQYDWKMLFPGQTIDDDPPSDAAAAVTSARASVISAECGTRRAHKAKKKPKKKATETMQDAKAAPAATGAGAAQPTTNTKATGKANAKKTEKPKAATGAAAGATSAKPDKARVATTNDTAAETPAQTSAKPIAAGANGAPKNPQAAPSAEAQKPAPAAKAPAAAFAP